MSRPHTTKKMKQVLEANGYTEIIKPQRHCTYYAWVKDNCLIISTGDRRLATSFAFDHLEDEVAFNNKWGWNKLSVSDVKWLNS